MNAQTQPLQGRNFRLSKSKIMVGRQCHKRLWLQTYRPELCKVSPESEHVFRMGHLFGDLARRLMGKGELVEHEQDIGRALNETPAALERARADRTLVFEPAFSHNNVCARADGFRSEGDGWHLLEVKSTTSLKEYFLFDCAIQAWVAEGAGYPVLRVTLGYVNTEFVCAGEGEYGGLLREQDVTAEVDALKPAAGDIARELQDVLAKAEPDIRTGSQCSSPYACPFIEHCRAQETPPPEYPVEIFNFHTAHRLRSAGFANALDVPEHRLESALDRRILSATRSGKPFYNEAVFRPLRDLAAPRYFLDFETLQSPVPLWAGTRPFQHIPFQWSCHAEVRPGDITHREFLDVSGELPARAFARSLVDSLGASGPVFVYSHFEKSCLSQLCGLVPELREGISTIIGRLVDLLQFVRRGYYHPSMKGSFSIKQVLPSLCPDLGYTDLGEVADGKAAQRAWWEASDATIPLSRKVELREALLRYCCRDSLAMMALHRALVLGKAVTEAPA